MFNRIPNVCEDYYCSADKALLNIEYIHAYLHNRSYWAKGIGIETVRASIQASYCAGVYVSRHQVGFARLVTDYATFGYLADVFVDENHRGMGLSKRLLSFMFSEPFIPTLRRIMLGTLDAHGLYEQYGFKSLAHPERFMEVHRADIYNPSTLPL